MAKFSFLREIFSDMDEKTFNNLIDDPQFNSQLPALIKARVDSGQNIVPINLEYLLILFSDANFADEEEKIYVSNRLKNYFHFEGDFLPVMLDYLKSHVSAEIRGERAVLSAGEDFASRCLFSLSFFQPALMRKYDRYGAPHPEFYREAGKKTFRYIGLPELSNNFDNWENFLGREFSRNF